MGKVKEADKVMDDVKQEKVDKERDKAISPQTYVVDVDNTYEQVLKLDKEGFRLVFDLERFKELSDEEVNGLSRDNWKQYYVAQGQVKQKKLNETRRAEPDYSFKGFEPLGGNAKRRMQKALRPRKGWHGCLKAPDELAEALEAGYTQIRRLSPKQEKEVQEGKKSREQLVGYESGEVVKIGQEDKPELIAVEIPEERWKEHLAYVGYMSKGRYAQNKQEYAEKARRAGLVPFDNEDEIS